MCWPGFDPNANHHSSHQVAEGFITEFMDFKWVFERLHHDSLESNLNHHDKPAKIIIIVKALYQGLAWAEHTQAWEEGLHVQQCQTRWCLAGQVMKVRMEPQAAQQPLTTLLQVMKDLRAPRHLPDTSKRGFIVSYGKKKKNSNCSESLHSSLLSKAQGQLGSETMEGNHTKTWHKQLCWPGWD